MNLDQVEAADNSGWYWSTGRKTKAEVMYGVRYQGKPKKIANNTWQYTNEVGFRVIRFHTTDILIFNIDGSIIFNTGGWPTVTTKDRMNSFQSLGYITQHKFLWWIQTAHGCLPFTDRMTVNPDGTIDR